MRWYGLLLALLMIAPATAQDGLVPVAAVSAVVTADMDGDFYRYRAVLVEVEGGADLYIFTEAGEGMRLAAHAPSIVWRGHMFGQEPELELAPNKSLRVISENEAVGRDRWRQTLTIAYRDGRFVVAGYTFSYRDTLDPEAGGECDVNLLAGRGVLNDKKFRTTMTAMPVENWTMDTRPSECGR